MGEFKGEAGTIYIERDDANERPFEVRFEDFCILGTGNSETEALSDAVRQVAAIASLLQKAQAVITNNAGGSL